MLFASPSQSWLISIQKCLFWWPMVFPQVSNRISLMTSYNWYMISISPLMLASPMLIALHRSEMWAGSPIWIPNISQCSLVRSNNSHFCACQTLSLSKHHLRRHHIRYKHQVFLGEAAGLRSWEVSTSSSRTDTSRSFSKVVKALVLHWSNWWNGWNSTAYMASSTFLCILSEDHVTDPYFCSVCSLA